jgi:hypothetical protein
LLSVLRQFAAFKSDQVTRVQAFSERDLKRHGEFLRSTFLRLTKFITVRLQHNQKDIHMTKWGHLNTINPRQANWAAIGIAIRLIVFVALILTFFAKDASAQAVQITQPSDSQTVHGSVVMPYGRLIMSYG